MRNNTETVLDVINENQYWNQVLDAIWDYFSSLEQYYYDPEEDHSYMPPEMQALINIPGLDDCLFYDSLLVDYDGGLNFDYSYENRHEDKYYLSWACKEVWSKLQYACEKYGLVFMPGDMGAMTIKHI